ncbi:FecR family protein [Pedobacter sp. SL55]|uniref:FecR family protein n=1 Tax=Pedobacter sp. SL55 TaxID=2995161 RepID=UPI00226EAAC1|nr:FecR family protein [Pedobacter sp. SL55]WAC39000.1 FecR domain-containing protein [Pedobacter sp. SL55]
MEKNAAKLLKKYLSGDCTPEEKAIVEDWYLQLPFQKKAPNAEQVEASHDEVLGRLKLRPKTRNIGYLKPIAVAASILLCVGLGFILFNREIAPTATLAKRKLEEVLPGGNKATLTLADGSVIDLDKALNGEITKLNGIIIRKKEDGQLEYIIQDNPGAASGTNTIATPRGGQYQVSLPDGTKVWLNAASSLTYPYPFAKNERSVELQGEAYFEVAKDRQRPFKVKASQQIIEVLGTHFNVNAYNDEPTQKTTLLEGAVKVAAGGTEVKLKPGEQAKFSAVNTQLVVDKNIDPDQYVAWKNEVFAFNNEDLKSVMRQISRWYDIDVVYKGKITTEKYFGEIPRSANLSEVFKILELNHVHVQISGKTMTITGD